MAKEKEKETISLEEAFVQLEKTVEGLEKPDTSLEDSFQAYKKGMELLKHCNQLIDDVEKKVLVIDESGKLNEF